MPNDTDELLLQRVAQGDQTAIDVLFYKYRDAAYRVAYRLLNHDADALDAVQEAFIKIFRRAKDFEQRSSFKTWLLRVVSNAALDIGRARNRRLNLLAHTREHLATQSDRSFRSDPMEQLIHEELQQALSNALQELSHGQREVFVLHTDGGLTYREISESLNLSVGTVMSRLFYARQKLLKLLGKRAEL